MASLEKAEVTVRRGSQGDLEAVSAIKLGSWADTYSSLIPPALLAPFLDLGHSLVDLRESTARPDALFLVAEDGNGAVTGFALAYLEPGTEPWLESLHVASGHRGRGVGTALVRELAVLLVARGYRTMSLGVVKGNEGAGRLYSRLGATLVGIEPTDWAAGVDHEVYRWADLAQLALGIYNPAR
jgi:ribosomal protein S18 acetylase RimI-like enzyme